MTTIVDRPPAQATVLGKPVWFTRRRYGTRTFTWVQTDIGGTLRDLGDPWPCITPKRTEMEDAMRRLEASDERLFIGVYPGGIVYSDRWVEDKATRDYTGLAFLPYHTLELEYSTRIHPLIPKVEAHALTLIEKRGQPFEISGCGQTVILGK